MLAVKYLMTLYSRQIFAGVWCIIEQRFLNILNDQFSSMITHIRLEKSDRQKVESESEGEGEKSKGEREIGQGTGRRLVIYLFTWKDESGFRWEWCLEFCVHWSGEITNMQSGHERLILEKLRVTE